MKLTNKKEIVKEVSEETQLSPEVVQKVLDAFKDILVESIVNDDPVLITNLFSVELTKPHNQKLPDGSIARNKVRPVMKLSRSIKILRRMQQGEYKDKPYFINRANWQGALAWAREGEEWARRGVRRAGGQRPVSNSGLPPLPRRASQIDGIINPILEEDYDE